MPFYHRLGQLPHKRHTQFRNAEGQLYTEEVMGLEGFSGIQSLLYHHYPPTRIRKAEKISDLEPRFVDFGALRARQFRTRGLGPSGDAVAARTVYLGNDDCLLGMAVVDRDMDYFYRNGQAYEVWFLESGEVHFRSQFGNLDVRPGDYLVIPFGVTWQMQLRSSQARFFTIECPSQVQPPKRYRNQHGQLLKHMPCGGGDFRWPRVVEGFAEEGGFGVRVRGRNDLDRHIVAQHPLGVVGWDGYLYPWIFSIHDFEPITGRIHQPPPVHQTFDAHNFVVCSFCPRLFDYHPLAIPAPYNHSNVNSDEVLFYVDGDFMSRRGVEQGDWTLHPSGLPHGPQPGATEASIGKTETAELAVMVDTFRPLKVSEAALEIEVAEYAYSWV